MERSTLKQNIEFLIDEAGFTREQVNALVKAARIAFTIVYIEDTSLVDATPVFVIGTYRTKNIKAAMKYLGAVVENVELGA